MLAVRDLCVRYGRTTVLDDVSFELDDGEILTLVGPTGCGKTTTLRVVAGLERPGSGALEIDGVHIDRDRFVPPEKRRTGLVFQDFALFPHLCVAENIGFRVRDRARVTHWMRVLGIEPLADAYPDTLSGGQKQRVALARSLAHEPSLILLDEPLSNLDAALKAELRWEIRAALKEAGVGALWVTHDQDEALSIGDRVGIMRAGRLEQLGPPEQCFSAPASRFVAQFLGEAVFLPGERRGDELRTLLGAGTARTGDSGDGPVDVLLRPDDVTLAADGDTNAAVEWSRYEGGTRLYAARLDDGPLLKVRTNHETHLAPGERVSARITAGHPLAAFPRESA